MLGILPGVCWWRYAQVGYFTTGDMGNSASTAQKEDVLAKVSAMAALRKLTTGDAEKYGKKNFK